MKTRAKYYINLTAGLFITFVSVLTGARANAQPRDLYFGFETTTSNRKYTVHSDLDNLKGKVLLQQGRTYGIIFGSSLVTGKFSLGNFSSSNGKSDQPIRSNSIDLAFHISPIQLFVKQDRVIEPYLVASVETTKVKSEGMYTPPKPSPQQTTVTCTCQCPSAGNASANISSSDTGTPAPQAYSGNYGTTRINLGVGVNVHLTRGKMFLNLFADMKYGIAAGTTNSTQALLYTYALNQVAYNMGAAIGISKNKSKGRLRRNRFR